jgi:O-antigen biosynthesis protein
VQNIRPAILYWQKHGNRKFLHLLKWKLFGGIPPSSGNKALPKTDPILEYNFIYATPTDNGQALEKCDPKTINWFIPMYGRGSGGHLNIFRFIFLLEKLGYKSNIIIIEVPGHNAPTIERAKKEISDYFFPLSANIYIGLENLPPAHVSFATSWQTAYPLRNFEQTRYKCYFVQDFEPWFYAPGSNYALAEETYRFGFIGITAGKWLADKLAAGYGMKTHPIGFAYDAELYRPLPRRESEIKRVFFYARPPTERRGFELGLMALHEVTKRLPGVVVCCAGWDVSSYVIPFRYLNAGRLELKDLPDLYNQCDVALVLSFSNLSLLPLEIMACGTPVVCNKGPNNEWLLNSNNARLTDPTPEAIADAVCDLLINTDNREKLIKGGFETTTIYCNWESEAEKLGTILDVLSA